MTAPRPCTVGGLPTSPGTLTLSPRGIDVTAVDGRALHLPFAALVIEVGGDGGEYLYLRSAGVTIWTPMEGMLEALEATAGSRLAPQIAAVRKARTGRRRGVWIGVGLLGAAALLLVLVAISLPSLAAASVGLLPTSLDVSLGDAAGSGLGYGAARTSPALEACIARPALHLAEIAEGSEGFAFQLEIQDSEEVNAFALPGGRMVVLTGLLRVAGDRDEALGVVAHEIAHVTHRDGLRGLARRAGIVAALDLILGGGSGVFLGMAGDAAELVTNSAYGREAEAEADLEGARTMARAGLDPLGMARFFERMEEIQGTELPHALAWLSDHPEHAERAAAIRALAPTLPASERPFTEACDWAALQAELGPPPPP